MGVAAPAVMLRLFDFAMTVELVILPSIDPAAVRAAHPLAHCGPAFRLKDVIEPQPLSLLRAKGFTYTHVAQRHARLIHQVIEWIVGLLTFGKPGPDICRFPVIDRIDVPGMISRRDGRPGHIVGETALALRGYGQKAVVRFVGANTNHHGGRALLRKPVGKFLHKQFEGHARFIK